MRLLRYHRTSQPLNTYTFSLVKCRPQNLPEYAILSHRWGSEEDEVTIKDIESGTAEARARGYNKLKFCADQASHDALKYFWVDTCCIDKSSSTELSEAINSMYKWYEKAAKCYVYLSDVSTKQKQKQGWEAAFQHSEWFGRGWTLQEQIAPRTVEFFSVEGIKLGNKKSLEEHIQQITGISIEALQGKPLSEITEQERFSWIAGRQTTVGEDAVYCLLGIFGVHMPLIHGEGQQKARTRLRREIQLLTRSEQVKEVADWYSATDFADQQTDQLSRRQPGTGGWFLARPEYVQWRQQPNSTLLCPGIPGSGKSVMVATVIDDLQTYIEANKDVVVAYLYCNFNRQSEQSLARILATLTRQLFQARSQLPDVVTALYKKHRERATRPSVDELRQVLQSLVCSYSRVFVVIDALDECENNACCDLLDSLFALQDSNSNNINVLATTRFIPEIVERFSQRPPLEVRANESDIKVYLTSHMARLARCVSRDARLQEAITCQIVNAAEGMFLLARLQFDSLRYQANPGQINNALAQLNKGSDALHNEYAKTIERIEHQPSERQELARKVLLWITYATRELSIGELREAIAVSARQGDFEDLNNYLDDEDQIISVCHGLIEVDQERRIVRLVHYTTQEYFEKVRDQWLPDGHVTISQSCLAYLRMNMFAHAQCQWGTDLTTTIKQYKLLEYAGKNWGVHARAIQNEQLQTDIINFLLNTDYLRFSAMVTLGYHSYWSEIYQCGVSNVSAAHISSCFGLYPILESLIQRKENVNCKDSDLETPLLYAAKRGHTEIVRLLLAQPAIELNTRNKGGDTALFAAAKRGHTETVQLLLTQPGIEIKVLDEYGETTLNIETPFRMLRGSDVISRDT